MKSRNRYQKTRSRVASLILAITLISLFFYRMDITVYAAGTSGIWTNYASKPTKKGDTYEIKSAAELAWVALQTNKGKSDFSENKIVITKDINLSKHYWVPIGTERNPFNGIFDGKNHTISNIKIGSSSEPDTQYRYVGLIGYAPWSDTYYPKYIDNVKIKNASIYSNYPFNYDIGPCNIGTVAGYTGIAVGTMRCSSTGTISANISGTVGGLLGSYNASFICLSYCSSTCDIIYGSYGDYGIEVGGLAGHSDAPITDSFATGDVTLAEGSKDTGNCFVGGLAGSSGSYKCYATGNVRAGANSNVGGLTGHGSCEESYATGNVSAIGKGCALGGLTGIGGAIKCYAAGKVSCLNNSTAGGLIGVQESEILNSYALGDLICKASDAGEDAYESETCIMGGLAGSIQKGTIVNCYSQGDITVNTKSTDYVGGFAGMISENNSGEDTCIYSCSATGNVTAGDHDYIGGFAGLVYTNILDMNHSERDFVKLNTCYATGNVTGGNDAYVGCFAGVCVDNIQRNIFWNSNAVLTINDHVETSIGVPEREVYIPAIDGLFTQKDSTIAKDENFMKSSNFIDILDQNTDPNILYEAYAWSLKDGKNKNYPIPSYIKPERALVDTSTISDTMKVGGGAGTLIVNNTITEVNLYAIDKVPYIRLRDLAVILDGTAKQFNISWDNDNKIVGIYQKTPYKSVGNGIYTSVTRSNIFVYPSSILISVDNGKAKKYNTYYLDGYNLFKFSDLVKILNLKTSYEKEKRLWFIKTK